MPRRSWRRLWRTRALGASNRSSCRGALLPNMRLKLASLFVCRSNSLRPPPLRPQFKRDSLGSSSGTPLHARKAMKAFVVDRYKSKSAVRLGEMPEPEVRDDDVLVQVHAASLNQLDSKIRDGEFKLILRYRLPLILGNDVAGAVVRVGSKVRRFKPGDAVYARPHQDRIGTFAEFIAMNESDVALKPKNLTMEEAASIPLVGLTAWQVLIERANLKK